MKRLNKGEDLAIKSVYEQSAEERFRAKFDVTESGCWNWRFTKPGRAEARANTFWINGTVVSAAKASWLLFRGEVPAGKILCHSCDNGLCVNPDHLWLGSNAENTADMIAKGRQAPAIGNALPQTKLTASDVRDIRAAMLNAPRGTLARLTRQFGVNKATIQDILLGKTWKHLSD